MWKPEHRRAADRRGLRCPSEWAWVAPTIPPAKRGGRRREVNVREVLNAIFYVLSTGCQWAALPKDLPPKSTAHAYFMLWEWDGTLERIHHALYVATREHEGRYGEWKAGCSSTFVRLAMIRIMGAPGLATPRPAAVGRLAELKRRLQLIRYDAYGKALLEGWLDELKYFIDTQPAPLSREPERRILAAEFKNLVLLIAQRVEEAADGFSDRMAGHEFEAYCAEELRRTGWQAYAKSGSRDQGVDVVAEKNELRLILQCKLYSQPAGNWAVQEAVAGRAHEGAQYEAVVTNNTYTPSAEQLAATNGDAADHCRRRQVPPTDSRH